MPVYSFKIKYIRAKGTGHEHPLASTSLQAKKKKKKVHVKPESNQSAQAWRLHAQ